jgi:predicted metal-dependent hydrolase
MFKIFFKTRLRHRRPKSKVSTAEYKKHKTTVLVIVTEKISKYNEIYNFTYNRITIRDQRTRWGSCSTKRNLNFNYRLMHLSPELLDYVIVHELCHLKEFNHSKEFWDLVGLALPNYKELRRRLKAFRIS